MPLSAAGLAPLPSTGIVAQVVAIVLLRLEHFLLITLADRSLSALTKD